METYFNIRYEFDKEAVHQRIASRLALPGSDYICVVDGNVTAHVYRSEDFRFIINQGLCSISDGSWTPIFLKLIYGIKRESYTGSDFFLDIIKSKKYSMIFLGGSPTSLEGLRSFLIHRQYPADLIHFVELPFRKVEEFDYELIANTLNKISSDIIWVGLGAPKQEQFMNKLRPYLNHGIMIGVGAVFNFYGNTKVKRAPWILRKAHLEFVHRLIIEPKKQFKKLSTYLRVLPNMIIQEYKNKKINNGNQ